MSLNCPHAWEEYKKLDSAYDALRREYLALRGEQSNDNSNELRNVHKNWLVKMREFRGRCLALKDVFYNIEEKYDFIKLKSAEKIMQLGFYGPEDIENAFGFAVDMEKIPAIPYSLAELRRAKELGERLVLRISEDGEGNTMTMEHLANLAQARMDKNEGKLLYNSNDWYKDEEFYKKSALRTEWKLVGGTLLTDSMYKTYAEQTKVLRDYLKGIGALTAAEEAECSDESLAKIANDSKGLVNLKINQNHRRSPGEFLYDWFLYVKKFNSIDHLRGIYDWTNVVGSHGNLVDVGASGRTGVDVHRSYPIEGRHDMLGVISIR